MSAPAAAAGGGSWRRRASARTTRLPWRRPRRAICLCSRLAFDSAVATCEHRAVVARTRDSLLSKKKKKDSPGSQAQMGFFVNMIFALFHFFHIYTSR